jgi:hypothetical protein
MGLQPIVRKGYAGVVSFFSKLKVKRCIQPFIGLF